MKSYYFAFQTQLSNKSIKECRELICVSQSCKKNCSVLPTKARNLTALLSFFVRLPPDPKYTVLVWLHLCETV